MYRLQDTSKTPIFLKAAWVDNAFFQAKVDTKIRDVSDFAAWSNADRAVTKHILKFGDDPMLRWPSSIRLGISASK